MDSYSPIPSQQQQQQQQTGYNNNPLGLTTNHALLQQTQSHQYNFGTQQPINPRVMNAGVPQQQQMMERNYGNPNLQMRGLGGEGGNNMASQFAFQGRQSLPTSAAAPIPPISALGSSIFNNNNMNASNMLNFQSLEMFQQSGLNRALGQTVGQRPNMMLLQQQSQQQQIQQRHHQYQQQQQNQQQQQQQQQQLAARQRQMRQQHHLIQQQIRRPMSNPSPAQNLHHRPSHQKQSAEPTKKSQASNNAKPYEPAPDLTPVQKQYLEQYVRRDTLYQKALDLQHKRQMNIINEKRKEIAQAEQRHQTRLSTLLFGPGYEGYGNGTTGTKFRVVYPHDRKRPKKTKEFKFSLQQLREIAEKEDLLVPIRLEIDGSDGYKLRDTFTWNINETFITPEHFAEVLCDDLHFPAATFAPSIVKQIREQLQGYISHPLSSSDQFSTSPVLPSLTNSSEHANVPKEENDKDGESNILNNSSEESNIHEELRILIKIDVTIGNISLVDQFEWDVNCQKNDPELFAEILAAELGLGGEFKTAIAHSIREQIQIYVKSLILVGHPFDGSPIQDDDLRQSFLPPVTNIIRKEDTVDQHTPILVELTEAEIDKIEKDRERDARRKRRQTRGRRGVILPDREPPKTHRTLLHSTTIIPDPTDESGFITLISSGMPPVMRKASSMGYDNYSAISEKAPTPSSKVRGRGRTAGSGLRGIISINSPDITDLNSTGRSGSVGPSPQGREPRDGAKKSNRRAGKEPEEWHCDRCGCSQTATPLLRKGPNGDKTLCNACGLYFQKNNTMRPISQITSEDEFKQETNPSVNSDKPFQPLQQETLSTPNQSFEFTADDKQLSTLTEQNLVSKQHFETKDNQNLTHSPVTSAKSPVTTPNTPLSNESVFPKWIIQQRDLLQQKYPRDRFDIVQRSNNEFRMKCFDCPPGRLYQPGPGLSLDNFEIHLKNRDHRSNVEKRLNPDWTIHMAEVIGSAADNSGAIPGTIDESEFSSPVSGTGDPFASLNTNNRAIGLVEGSITSSTPIGSDFSRLHSKEISPLNSQSLEMPTSINSPGYEATAIGVFIDNSNGIPQTPKSEAFSSKSKGSL